MTQAPANAARSLLHHPATAWVILLLSFALTGVAWHLSDKYVRQRAQERQSDGDQRRQPDSKRRQIKV